nr:hypothetical protein [Tanacetum cinerariifolium]
MSRDVLTVGSTMRIPLLYRGEYSQWVERFMNYLEEQTDGEAMINLIKNGDQPLPRVTQVSIAGTTSTEQPPLKDKSMWSDQEKRVQKIDRLARFLLIQGLSNDIYSFVDSNKTAKDLWDALARHMLGSEYREKDRKAAEGHFAKDCKKVTVKDYEYYKTKMLLAKKDKDEQVLLAEDQAWMESSSDSHQEINENIVFMAQIEKKKAVVVTSDPLALIAEKTNVTRNKEKMLLAKKDKDEQVLLAEDQAWMESSSDSDQEINANMVFMAQIEKVLSNSKAISSSADEKISKVPYYLSELESESEYETLEYYDNSTNYGLFVNNDDDQEIFHDAIESAIENFIENHIDSQKDYDKSDVDQNDSEEKEQLVDKLIRKFNKKIVKCQNHV